MKRYLISHAPGADTTATTDELVRMGGRVVRVMDLSFARIVLADLDANGVDAIRAIESVEAIEPEITFTTC